MKRSAMVRKPKKRKAKAIKALRASKPQTRSKVSKGPARDEKHLALVRRELCLVCRGLYLAQMSPTHAHHCRSGMLGKRPSDYLTVPLCAEHHLDQFPTGLHKRGEKKFWADVESALNIKPQSWLKVFLARTYPEPRPERVTEALAMIEKQMARTVDRRTVWR